MVAKRFFYICAGILCLALAYHFGAQSATAQGGGNPAVAVNGYVALAANGDVFVDSDFADPASFAHWARAGNIFTGPTPAFQPTWGQLKSRYRQPAPATQDK